jgi:hypothetical protein
MEAAAAAAVKSTVSTVKSAAVAPEASATVSTEAIPVAAVAALESTAVTMGNISAGRCPSVSVAWTIAVARPVSIPWPTVAVAGPPVIAMSVVAATAVVAVSVVPLTVIATAVAIAIVPASIKSGEPRTGAYERATYKVARPVIAVRSAGIRVVAVISIVTNRSRTIIRADSCVNWTDRNSNRNLCICTACGEQNRYRQNSQKNYVLYGSHGDLASDTRVVPASEEKPSRTFLHA